MTPLAEVDVANLALAHLTHGEVIASLDEESTEARLCGRFLNHVRRVVLAAHPWPGTTTREALALLPDTAPAPWAYAYAPPPDSLKLWAIDDGLHVRQADERIPWAKELKPSKNGHWILTDQKDAVMIYTPDLAFGLLPALVAEVCSFALAAKIAGPLTKDRELTTAAQQAYVAAFHRAVIDTGEEKQAAPPPVSIFLAARG